MKVLYVLIMIFSTSSYRGGMTVVQHEFNSLETCEAARAALAKAHTGDTAVLRAQGCFLK